VVVDKDGRLEIVYYCRSESRSLGALPGVYRFNGQRWVSIAPQADRFSLRDLDGDGKMEIIAALYSTFVVAADGSPRGAKMTTTKGRVYAPHVVGRPDGGRVLGGVVGGHD